MPNEAMPHILCKANKLYSVYQNIWAYGGNDPNISRESLYMWTLFIFTIISSFLD